ncbi:hypothetical protein fugu_008265 [Takifugu bimaculatus]|uniref:Hook C-terminal domain-containing protein n=1 Tax=Takifugu bimaculatus TaxID=433685 RepID=A0A4Z2B0W6_9TELE|nr:hypothetical protein fugu_008265 [Takifugu bimaculatus]
MASLTAARSQQQRSALFWLTQQNRGLRSETQPRAAPSCRHEGEVLTSNKKEAHFSSSAAPTAEGSRQQGQPGESMDTRQDEEEEVILAAWRTMTSALQRHHLSNDSTSGPTQSFLTRQRQATKARRGPGPRLQSW